MVMTKHQKEEEEAKGSNLPATLVHMKLGCNVYLVTPLRMSPVWYIIRIKGPFGIVSKFVCILAFCFIFRLVFSSSAFQITSCFFRPVTEDRMFMRVLVCFCTSNTSMGPVSMIGLSLLVPYVQSRLGRYAVLFIPKFIICDTERLKTGIYQNYSRETRCLAMFARGHVCKCYIYCKGCTIIQEGRGVYHVL